MRSDNLKRHAQSHKDILTMTDDEVRDELRVRHATEVHREERKQEIMEIALQEGISIDLCDTKKVDIKSLRDDLLRNNREYLDKIDLGNQIADIIDEGVVREESLTKERKEALDLYRKQMPRIDIQSTQLRPWQAELMKMIDQPSYREIFWILGVKGNEGKSWLQGYMETFYGYTRVVRLDLRNKTGNI